MRITFFILLLANLVVLLWHTQIGARLNREPKLPPIAEEQRLVMVNEYKQAQLKPDAVVVAEGETAPETVAVDLPDIEIVGNTTPAVSEPVPEQDPLPPAKLCYTLGPFKEQGGAKSATGRLRKIEAQVDQRSKVEQEQYGYRVYLKSYATREEAVAQARKLADQGIRDYYIISDESDHKNGISLGLFRKKSGAIRRMAQVRRFDFKPQMEIRYRDTTIYWLDYEHQADVDSQSLWRELVESEPGLQRLVRDC